MRTIHTQEIIRILRNCHEDVPEEVVNEFLGVYMKKLQNAGFSETFRREVLRSGRKGFKKQKEAAESGEKPLYRPRGYNKMERHIKKKASKTSWFEKGGYEDFLMIPATPGSELKKLIDQRLKALGLWEKMRVIEKPGMKFIEVLKMHNKND